MRRLLHRFHMGLDKWVVRVDQESDQASLGHQLVQQLQPLRLQLPGEKHHARGVAAGSAEVGDEAKLYGSAQSTKTIGVVPVAAFAASAGPAPPDTTRTATLRRTSSVASAGRRSSTPLAHRNWISTFLPSP